MKYKQLTEGLRYQISLLIGKDYSLSDIAKESGVHKSTISREIKRNQLENRYRTVSAHKK
ncbi:helix-turn-helix domain-containing protein [Thorsellia kenyensis]|uniref:Helix-turn-helix domain-containing protein n=1 Tax=Thorsellia kenyensis TaxID=1549888 RepID=A0ABV6CDE1_9GAMM